MILMPKFKKLMLLVLLFPINIQQVAAISQDSITLSMCFLTTAYILNKVFDKKSNVGLKETLTILGLSLGLGCCKPIYFPILLFTLLIPKDKFKNKKFLYITKILPIFIFFIGCIPNYVITVHSIKVANDNIFTPSYGITHPIELTKLLLRTFIIRGSNDILYLVINLFGWSSVFITNISASILYFVYTLLVFFDNKDVKLTLIQRLFFIILGFGMFALVQFSSLAFGITYLDSQMVGGLQSRYFIPSLIFIYIGLSNDFVKINFKDKNKIVYIIIALTFTLVFRTILRGFY